MRIIRTMVFLLIGASFFLPGCGAPAGQTGPPESPPAASPQPAPGAAPAPTAAATGFTTSNLTVTPSRANPGETVMVGVIVRNNGAEQGTYKLVVKDHDGVLLGTKDVTLAGGARETVTLQISINKPGTHMVMVDKLFRDLIIQDAAAPMPGMPPAQPAANPTPAPPSTGFSVTSLDIEPAMLEVGENITVSFLVRNNGTQQAVYLAEVKIDGTTVATQNVTVAAGATQRVNVRMMAPGKIGTFTFSVGDQSRRVEVMAH